MDELDMQVGQIVEFMAQIRDQSEFSNSNIANSKAESEIDEAITLEGDMKDEVVPEPSKHSPNMDELLLQAEEEEDDLGSLEEFQISKRVKKTLWKLFQRCKVISQFLVHQNKFPMVLKRSKNLAHQEKGFKKMKWSKHIKNTSKRLCMRQSSPKQLSLMTRDKPQPS
ncbi:hypothetical protein EV2_007276 [Malus domestica]